MKRWVSLCDEAENHGAFTGTATGIFSATTVVEMGWTEPHPPLRYGPSPEASTVGGR